MGATRSTLRLRFWDPTTALVPLLTDLRPTLVVSPRSAIVPGCIEQRAPFCKPQGGWGDDLFGPKAILQHGLGIDCVPRTCNREAMVGILCELPPNALEMF